MRIQAFVNLAFQWYREAIKSTEDNSRYLFNPISEPTNAAMHMAHDGIGRRGVPRYWDAL